MRFIKRWRFTIMAALCLGLLAILCVVNVTRAIGCNDRGGEYVWSLTSWTGYSCVGGTP